ncbi:MAG: HNH endonuclease signature motif containing protein [Aestuariivita sp.]|nr:HNH endonuclease signature motif containing protein [Aestuariivita sp.]
MVYVCSGTDSEKLKWYEVINIAGAVLTRQELRNATYTGPWLADARRYFSKPGGAAYGLGSAYLKGSALRQDYLETTLAWISDRDGVTIEEYMSAHQEDPTVGELWRYFQSVISWVETVFPNTRPSMKGVEWGPLYDAHHMRRDLDPVALEAEVARLHKDDDVTRNAGIYAYLLTGDEKHLSIRSFTPAMREAAYERQAGICPICGNHFAIEEMEADHITPWSKGGATTPENCQMLSRECNRRKGAR